MLLTFKTRLDKHVQPKYAVGTFNLSDSIRLQQQTSWFLIGLAPKEASYPSNQLEAYVNAY